MLLDVVDDALTRAEVGYLGAASLLCALLALVYRGRCVTRDGPPRDGAAADGMLPPARTFDHARRDAPL
jgi:hypothetical protein